MGEFGELNSCGPILVESRDPIRSLLLRIGWVLEAINSSSMALLRGGNYVL